MLLFATFIFTIMLICFEIALVIRRRSRIKAQRFFMLAMISLALTFVDIARDLNW